MKHGHLSKHVHGALSGDAPAAHLSRLSVADVPAQVVVNQKLPQSEPPSHLTSAALPASGTLDGSEQSNQVDSEAHGETYESLPATAPPASLESFNSLYNLPPGFIERKTPREVEYERRVMSRLLSHGDPPPSPRSQGRHLAPNADAAAFDRSASRAVKTEGLNLRPVPAATLSDKDDEYGDPNC
ncbi:hypothetical protein Esti_004131 [Eimeria stiedai]